MATIRKARDQQTFVEFAKFVKQFVKDNYPTDREPYEFEEWLSRTNYSERRKEHLRRVKQRTDEPGHILDTRVKLFVKDESYMEYKHARGIYARNDEFKVVFGPYVKRVEDVVYNDPHFIKHVPIENRAEHIKNLLYQINGTYIATDYTSFESNFDLQFNSICDRVLFNHIFSLSRHKHKLNKLLDVLSGINRIDNRSISVLIKARRMSGEMNTSLSNGFANYMVFKFLTRNCKYSNCIIEGDDCLGVVVGEPPKCSDYEKLGFRIKLETFTEFNKACFCGMLFEPNSLQFVKEPTKILLNTGWTSFIYLNSSTKTKRQLAKSKAMSLICEVPHCPIIGQFSRAIMKSLKDDHYRIDKTNSYNIELVKQFKMVNFAPTLSTRVLFQELFNVSITQQLFIENYFETKWNYGPFYDNSISQLFSEVAYLYNSSYVGPYLKGKFYPANKMGKKKNNKGKPKKKQNNFANGGRRIRKINRPNPRNDRILSDGGIMSKIGSSAGSIVGGPAGRVIGSILGMGADKLYNYVRGSGDYTVMSNTLSDPQNNSLPSFVNSNSGNRIVHKEYIADVITSSVANSFKIDKYPIQPAYTFPWLSTVAQQYQQYRINGMIFEFKTTSSDALNSTNTALGEVILSTQYNVNTADPVNPAQMYQLEHTSSCKPSHSVLHPIECAKNQSPTVVLDTRNGSIVSVANSDLRLYDLGNFYIATNGMQGTNVNIGQLWVSYDISLIKPQLGAAADVADHYLLPSTVTNTNFFGTTIPSATTSSDLGSKLSGTGGNGVITIPPYFTGNIMLYYVLYGASTPSLNGFTITATNGATSWKMLNNYTTSANTPTGTSSQYVVTYFFTCVGGGTITFTGSSGTLVGSITGGDLYLISIPSTLTN